MFCPSRILVPVDFSSSSMPAARYAHDVARIFGSRVHLLHVSPEPTAQGWSPLVPSGDLEVQAEEWRVDAMNELTAFAALAPQTVGQQLGGLGPALAVRVSSDVPATIVAYAREVDCDLIVMGTHRPSVRALLRGSCGDWVRRHAACPVLLVPLVAELPERQSSASLDVERPIPASC
jgi:nucleotide-binding universal stress UspA family protein